MLSMDEGLALSVAAYFEDLHNGLGRMPGCRCALV
jgi:hypothetical protein